MTRNFARDGRVPTSSGHLRQDHGASPSTGSGTHVDLQPELVERYGEFDGTCSRAVFSSCGKHRFLLSRKWNRHAGIILFVMLNPSSATETRNDPTIGRCHSFAMALNGGRRGGYEICNLFSFVTHDRKQLASAIERNRSRENDRHLADACGRAARLICAWGGSGAEDHVRKRAEEAIKVIRSSFSGPLECLAINRNGTPRHPLYLPANTRPMVWPVQALPQAAAN